MPSASFLDEGHTFDIHGQASGANAAHQVPGVIDDASQDRAADHAGHSRNTGLWDRGHTRLNGWPNGAVLSLTLTAFSADVLIECSACSVSDFAAGSLAQAVHTLVKIVNHVAETWRDNDRPTELKSSESTVV